MKSALTLFAAFAVTACLPLTLGHDGSIDFNKYQTVYVQPVFAEGADIITGTDSGYQDYIAAELAEESGFSIITTDETVPHDCVLVVSFVLEATIDLSENEDEYTVDADYTLREVGGQTIISGSVRDEASYADRAIDLALDEVVHAFLRPYRL